MIVIQLCSLISSISAADEQSTAGAPEKCTRFPVAWGWRASTDWWPLLWGDRGLGAPAEKISGDVDDACARAGIDAIREDIEFAE